jgi:translation initiation factor IF-3
VAPNANPPVCRIMDYGKFKFDAAQRAKESRRKTSSVTLKEMKYRVKIGQGDFDTKTRKVIHFLDEGHKVKITIMFRGRETAHPHLGKEILDRIAERAADTAKVESAPKLDGRNMIMVLAPDKRAQAAARANKAQAAEPPAGSPNGSTTTTGDTATPAPAAPDAPEAAAPVAATPDPEQQTQE